MDVLLKPKLLANLSYIYIYILFNGLFEESFMNIYLTYITINRMIVLPWILNLYVIISILNVRLQIKPHQIPQNLIDLFNVVHIGEGLRYDRSVN